METNRKININIPALFRLIVNDKRKLCIYGLAGAVVGVVIAFSIPKFYKSSTMLAPEMNNSLNLSGGLSSLASMVGMSTNFGNNDDAIYPEIYPDLISSNDFIVGLFDVKVKTRDGKVNTTYADYLKHHQKQTWWSYPGKLLAAFIENLQEDDTAKGKNANSKPDPYMLTRKEDILAKGIRNDIKCAVDKKTSVISIEVTAQDPLIAATMTDSIRCRLQEAITNYRTNKARGDLKYVEKLYEEARKDYIDARNRYASFGDSYQDLSLPSYKSKMDDLENEMQLKFNIYTQVTEQLQLSRAKLQERTPAFTVVQAASVPVKHSNRPKVFTMMVYLFLALLLRIAMLCWKNREEVFGA